MTTSDRWIIAIMIVVPVLGAVFGGIGGCQYTRHIVAQHIKENPDDPNASSVGTVVAVFVPGGAAVGAFVAFFAMLFVLKIIDAVKRGRLASKSCG